MKTKTIAGLVSALLIGTSGAFNVSDGTTEITIKANSEGLYSKLFVVTETDSISDTVWLTDCNGNSWGWLGIEDIEVGDYYSAVMNDNGTTEIKDDFIVSLRYERPDLLL